MYKVFLLTFMVLLTGLAESKANASTYVTYPDFVLMKQSQRYEVIEMVQDYTVEMEQQWRNYVLKPTKKTSYYDWFISNAYAQVDREGRPCLYAGWPSVLQTYKNATYCNNPRKYNLKESNVFTRYRGKGANDDNFFSDLEHAKIVYDNGLDKIKSNKFVQIDLDSNNNVVINESGDKECNINSGDIICNPIIFGEYEGNVMCIPGDKPHSGYNASFLCERTVAHLKADTEHPERYENLMNGIVDRILAKKEVINDRAFFLRTMQDMYQMCMCGDTKGAKGRIHHYYAKNMYNSRTCTGLIHQTNTLLAELFKSESSCQIFEDIEDGQENLFGWFKDAHKNLKDQIEHLNPQYVSDVSEIKNRKKEQKSIEAERNASKDKVCKVDVEDPDDVTKPDPNDDDNTNPDDGNDNGGKCTLVAKLKVPEVEKDTEENKSDDQQEENKEEEKEVKKQEFVITFTPGKDKDGKEKKLDAYKFEPALEFGEDKFEASYLLDKEEQKLTASAGENDSCDVTLPGDVATDNPEPTDNPTDEPTDQNDEPKECKVTLAFEETEGGNNVIATVTADGETIEGGADGYTVSFYNTSVEEDDDEDDASEEETVGDAPVEKEDSPGVSLEDAEIEGKFAAFLPYADEEQEVMAKLTGPGDSCSASATLSGGKQPVQYDRKGPRYKQPQLMQKRRPRGYILRGNR